MNSSKVLIVWGMHRSGTSMVASWLAACGLDLGKDLLGAGLGNENGHYEDIEFLGLHERILNENRIDCGGVKRINPLRVSKQHLLEMKEIIKSKSENSMQWGWKEPRTCLFYKEYIDLVPDALHLVVFRDYRLVVDSLVRRKISKFEMRNSRRSGLKAYYYRFRIFMWRKFSMRRISEKHLKAWIKYNDNLIKLADSVSPEKCLVMDCDNFIEKGEEVFSWLLNNRFNLDYVEADKCSTPGMMASSSDNNYEFNKSSLSRADAVLKNLKVLAGSYKDNV